jgi:transposase
LSEIKKYRKFTAQQKTEIVLASLRGPKTMTELCREHDIADSLLRKWREQSLAAGAERLSGKTERTELDELRSQVSKLERALGSQDDGGEGRGGTLAGMKWPCASPVPASLSRKAARPPWSPAWRASAARRSTAAPSGRRRASDAGSITSTGSFSMLRGRTRLTAPGWSPPWPPASWPKMSIASECSD